jgi:hypothetical protein
MKSEVTFQLSGQDSLAQFTVWLLILGAGCLPLPVLIWKFGGNVAAVTSVAIALVVLIGLRSSIVVSSSGVVMVLGPKPTLYSEVY